MKQQLLYTVVDMMQLLQVSKTTIHNHISAGTLPSVKIGRRRYFPVKEIDKLFAAKNIKWNQ